MLRHANEIIRGGLGVILSFWIAGAGCMFGCSEMALASNDLPQAPAAGDSLATIVSGDACASSGSHDCCARKKAPPQENSQKSNSKVSLQLAAFLSQREAVNSTPSEGARECPLALSRAIAISKASDQKQFSEGVIALPAKVVATQTSPVFEQAVAPAARLPNRGHTYLDCCVFLI